MDRQPIGEEIPPARVVERRPVLRQRILRKTGEGPEHGGAVGRLVHQHDRLSHGGVGQHGLLDLAKLDALAVKLDLMVDAPGEFQTPVDRPAAKVTGSVEAPLIVFHEALNRQVRSVQVTARQPHTAEPDLARHAGRYRVAVGAADGDPRVGRGRRRYGGVPVATRHDPFHRDQDACLRRAIGIPEGQRAGVVRRVLVVRRLAAGQEDAQPLEGECPGSRARIEGAWNATVTPWSR